jgi:hypothetical protein
MATTLKTGSQELRDIVNAAVDIRTYDAASEESAAAASGALSVAVRTSNVAVDGTDARTLAAPTFAGQYKQINVTSGANTPILDVTVTGTRVSTQNVIRIAGMTTGQTASVTLYSPDGTVWDVVGSAGTVTIS